jgi:hypothetical protein
VDRLEQENEQMEQRLRQFREAMAQQKAKKAYENVTSIKGMTTWSSGNPLKGSLSSYGKQVLARKGFKGIQRDGKIILTQLKKK